MAPTALERPAIDWTALPAVEADLYYLPRAAGRRITLDFSDGYLPPVERVATRIHDIGWVRGALSLDREGFVVVPFAETGDHHDAAWIATVWRPAVEATIRRLTGASHVASWAFNMRFSSRDPQSARTPISRPASNAHSDFGPDQFGPVIGHPEARAAVATATGGRCPARWRCFNVWQAISPAPLDSALALCDASSLAPDDMCLADTWMAAAEGGGFPLELCQYRHNPAQRWGYFRGIRQDELLVFSGLDPSAGLPWRVVPHTAFDDPACPEGTQPRASVEIRVIALFDDAPTQ